MLLLPLAVGVISGLACWGWRKAAIGICILYLLCPIDLIPDFIPVIGWADDLLVLALLRKLTRRNPVTISEIQRRRYLRSAILKSFVFFTWYIPTLWLTVSEDTSWAVDWTMAAAIALLLICTMYAVNILRDEDLL